MKKGIIAAFVLAITLMGCKKETPEVTPTEPTEEETKPVVVPKTECYAYELKGNKIDMQVDYDGTNLSGTLNYLFAEKDNNVGTFTGKLENEILLLEYTFQSEGVQSVRQVAFQIQGDKLVEGYGEMTDDGTHFKDVSTLKFDSKMPLTKIDCPKDVQIASK